MRASSAAQTTNETASTPSAMPGLPSATRVPPIAGPSTATMLRDMPCSAFACCRRSALTVCGTRPTSAGMTMPAPTP